MAEIPNRGVKSTKKLSDIGKKQKKDIFIFCALQKMNLFKKTKEKRYFGSAGAVCAAENVQAEEVERRDAKGAGIRWRESDKKRHEAQGAERGVQDAGRRQRLDRGPWRDGA